jgi:hypothetical protein
VLDIKNFLSALPTGWLDAATAATLAGDGPLEQYLRSSGLVARHFSRVPTQRELEVECGFVGGLGWYLGTNPVSVSELTVSQATLLQLGPLFQTRLRYHQDFVSCVAPPGVRLNPVNVDRCCKAIAAAQRHLWKLKWDNAFKEVFWRLVLNGLATAERMHQHNCSCVCGPVDGGQRGRQHHYWDCPVAQAVVGVMQQQLGEWFDGPLQPHHVLCMLCPEVVGVVGARAMHKGVWRVVCLAAINAMDLGRKAARKLHVEQQQEQQAAQQQQPIVPQGQRLITDLLQPAVLTADQQQHQAQVRQRQQLQVQQQQQQQQQAAAARLAEVKQQAVGRFWELLSDFIALEAAPESWLSKVAPDHPFLRVTDGHLGVHCVAATPDAG